MSFKCPHCAADLTVSVDKPRTPPHTEVSADLVFCAAYWAVPLPRLLSQRKDKRLAEVRKTIYAVLRKRGYSTPEIGFVMNRNPSSVYQGSESANPKLVESTMEALCLNRDLINE